VGHFEGRGWRGFHHHATLCIAVFGFPISRRETIPPQEILLPRPSRNLPYAKVTSPEDPPLRPGTPRSELDCNDATEIAPLSQRDSRTQRKRGGTAQRTIS
jgi:hypothetical protein